MRLFICSMLAMMVVGISNAQDSAVAPKYDTTVVKMMKDKKTGVQTLQLKEGQIIMTDSAGNDAVVLKLYKKNQAGAGKTVVIELQDKSQKLKCINEMDVVMVHFADGSELDVYQNGLYNCKGNAVMHFGGNWGWTPKIKALSEKEISWMRIYGNGAFVDARLTKKQSEDLRKAIKSVLEYTF